MKQEVHNFVSNLTRHSGFLEEIRKLCIEKKTPAVNPELYHQDCMENELHNFVSNFSCHLGFLEETRKLCIEKKPPGINPKP
jgi:hypothetical protein